MVCISFAISSIKRAFESKFHFGHEFAALGLLCETATQWILFPVWVRLIVPKQLRYKGNAVLEHIFSRIPRRLVVFDKGFARRKVFQTLLVLKHHILCRANSNVVFYCIPKLAKCPKPGCPKKYGDRLNIRRLRYKVVSIIGKTIRWLHRSCGRECVPQMSVSLLYERNQDVQNRIGISVSLQLIRRLKSRRSLNTIGKDGR